MQDMRQWNGLIGKPPDEILLLDKEFRTISNGLNGFAKNDTRIF